MGRRAGLAGVAVCGVAFGLWAATGGSVGAAVLGVIQVAELPDMPLSVFHNVLFRYPIDQIADDHGVRMGSLGSDLFHDPADSYNEFWTVTDRGPNGNPGRRTFVAPKFDPVILHVRVQDNRISILGALPILDAAGLPVSGLSNVDTFDETPYDFNGVNVIAGNPNGVDTEGLVRLRDGTFWLVDEYSPSLLHVDASGRIMDRYVPEGSPLGATLATTPNYRVRKTLPRILNFRRQNRGFEGIAVTPDERILYLAMQSPLDYPTTTLGRASRSVRILRFDLNLDRVTGEWVYFFDEVCAFLAQAAGCGVVPGEMKISSLTAIGATTLLVNERTDTVAKIYRVDLAPATNIFGSTWDAVAAAPGASTPALESLADPASQGVTTLAKTLIVNLATFPDMPNKIEGTALVQKTSSWSPTTTTSGWWTTRRSTAAAGSAMTRW